MKTRSCLGAPCKTVGLAYVGSNPTPATDKLAGQTPSQWAGSYALRERFAVTAPCAGRLGCGPCSDWSGCCERGEWLAVLGAFLSRVVEQWLGFERRETRVPGALAIKRVSQ
jgi:hypothetical protein